MNRSTACITSFEHHPHESLALPFYARTEAIKFITTSAPRCARSGYGIPPPDNDPSSRENVFDLFHFEHDVIYILVDFPKVSNPLTSGQMLGDRQNFDDCRCAN
jgi:hypothetical protein